MIDVMISEDRQEVRFMDLYKKYYLDEKEILDIISEGIVVFDASALLDIYYYSDESQEQIFNALSGLKNRLWVPAQCYFEYLKNKDKVAGKPCKAYEALIDRANKNMGYVPRIASNANDFGKEEIGKLKGLLKTLKETTAKKDKHPYLNQELFASFDQAISELEEYIGKFSKAAEEFEERISEDINKRIEELKMEKDNVRQFIECKFEIGNELSFEKMLEICEEGRKRYNEKIPPGYEDAKNKSGLQKYGDLFVWKEILCMAKKKKKDVILITNDVKADWWDKEQKAPCFELLKEFRSVVGRRFWSCSMKDFLYKLNERDGQTDKILESVIDEVDDVARQMLEDSLKVEIEHLHSEELRNWIESESEYILGDRHELLTEWRVFGTCYLYDAINYRGDESLVMMNLIEKSNHSSVLHAFNNLMEIKRYFEKLGKKYRYRQVVVTKSRETAKQIYNQVQSVPKLMRIYYNSDIENDLVYLSSGELIYFASNHPMG